MVRIGSLSLLHGMVLALGGDHSLQGNAVVRFDRWLLGIATTRVGLLAVSGQHERALHAAKERSALKKAVP